MEENIQADPVELEKAAKRRFRESCSQTLQFGFKAIPEMSEEAQAIVLRALEASGFTVEGPKLEAFKKKLARIMTEAFTFSHQSLVRVVCHLGQNQQKLQVAWEPVSVVEHYDRWVDSRPEPFFGQEADAKVLQVARDLLSSPELAALDVGAGTGRNSVAMAELGYSVTAVEPTPTFAERIRDSFRERKLAGRIIVKSILDPSLKIPKNQFRIVVASQVFPEIHRISDLRRILDIIARSLKPGGRLVFNHFVGEPGFRRTPLLSQAAASFSSAFLTVEELLELQTSLGFEQLSQEKCLDFETAHLPPEAWPPSPWFEDWSRGRHIFTLEDQQTSPIQSSWFTWTRTPEGP
jgi:SAM-dependent methyltransferase